MDTYSALLISLPTANATLRMRVWRVLKGIGSGVLRDGVYVLPMASPRIAMLSEVEKEIKVGGGFAMAVDLSLKTPQQLAHVRRLFDRTKDYAAAVSSLRAATTALKRLGKRKSMTLVQRLRRAVEEVSAIDYYPGQAKVQAEEAMLTLEREVQRLFADGEPHAARRKIRQLELNRYRNRTWATRKDLWVDRIACVWLIRRFIDTNARFVWVERPRDRPKGAVGFDFDGAEFTHTGNRVTFEVLLASFGLDGDPALASIGQAVHFLDVGGIPVEGAKGLETVMRGIKLKARSDDDLAKEASRVLDHYYLAMQQA